MIWKTLFYSSTAKFSLIVWLDVNEFPKNLKKNKNKKNLHSFSFEGKFKENVAGSSWDLKWKIKFHIFLITSGVCSEIQFTFFVNFFMLKIMCFIIFISFFAFLYHNFMKAPNSTNDQRASFNLLFFSLMDKDFDNSTKKEKGSGKNYVVKNKKNCYLGHVKIGLYEDQQF